MKAIKYKIDNLEIFEISNQELELIENNTIEGIYNSFSTIVITMSVSLLLTLLDTRVMPNETILCRLYIIFCTSILGIFIFRFYIYFNKKKSIIKTIENIKNRKPIDSKI